jgi:predicted GIY-YIG superfamily endonuclease
VARFTLELQAISSGGFTSTRQGRLRALLRNIGSINSFYFETFENIEDAITREKHIKKWNRAWKAGLIEEKNLYWEDLYELICR